jgi:outer membrane receptor for Fe3+-dicitrate
MRRLFSVFVALAVAGLSLGLAACGDDDGGDGGGEPGFGAINGYPLECPRVEANQIDNMAQWFPISISNRFDLAPADGANCGQQRIVLANNSEGRMFMIFEAQIPNPNPGCGLAACRPVVEFWAQLDGVTDVQQLSLADLLDTQVDVASRKPQTTRETPGIVTMITRNDILNSSARDLLDVLALVPGFAPGVDVEGVVDLGIRGQWGHEGKILLQIDGQPMNELLYSTLQLANHYPLESIDRIEVIRGPGSAIYGGNAELAVINIITRDAISLDGVAVAATWGQLGRAIGHANTSLSFGATSSAIPELSVTGSVMIGHASSSGTYRDFAGASYAMHGNSDVDPMFGKLAVKLHGLRVNAMIDNYTIDTRDGVGPVMAETARQGFRAYYLDASYDIALRDHLTVTPRFDFIRQTPWEITDPSSELFYTKTVSRYTAGLALSYDPVGEVNLLAGVEAHADRARLNDTTIVGFQTMFGDKPEVAYDTLATYAQLLVNHRLANQPSGYRSDQLSARCGSL